MPDTTFKDSVGRTWDVALNLGGARRIDQSDFSLLTDEKFSIINAKKETFAGLLNNPSLLFAIIWALVQPQAQKMYKRWIVANSPDDCPPDCFPFDPIAKAEEAEIEFISSINGPVKEAGTEAFWRSLGDFFPDLETALSLMMKHYRRGKQELSAKVADLEEEMGAAVDQKVQEGYQLIRNQLTLARKPGEASTV